MTDQFSHTPGPWAIDYELPPSSRSVIARVGCSGLGIPISGKTDGPHDVKEDEPNARLIAAAPDLLEACELARKSICGELDELDPENRIVLPALKAAIAKARGADQ